VAGSPVVCLRVKAPLCLQQKVVCACYDETQLLSHEQAPPGFSSTAGQLKMGCSHTLFSEDTKRPITAMSGSLPQAPDSCPSRWAWWKGEEPAIGSADQIATSEGGEHWLLPWKQREPVSSISTPPPPSISARNLRLCMATWNVGSEISIFGKGVGAGGVDDKSGELLRDLKRILRDGCSSGEEYDVVALTLQEGAEPQVLQDIEQILREDFGSEWYTASAAFAQAHGAIDVGPFYNLSYLHPLPYSHEYAEWCLCRRAYPLAEGWR